MTNNQPGWYPDPFGRAQVRWWSGNDWTDHVATNGQEFSDPPVPGASPAAAPAAAAPVAAAPAAAPAGKPAGQRATQTLAIVAVVALLVGGLAGWLIRGGGDDSGGGGGGGGAASGSLTTPILQGLASLNSYEFQVSATTVGPTEADRSDITASGQSDSANNLRHQVLTQSSTSADDPEGYTSTTESWQDATKSCSFDGEEYSSTAANPMDADFGTVLSGVFDIVIPAGNAQLVGEETVAGVAAQHYSFTIQGLAASSGGQVEQNQGDIWVAKDGGYLLKYQVTTALRTAPQGSAGAEVFRLTLTLELTSVNQPVSVQMPAACPAPTTDTVSG